MLVLTRVRGGGAARPRRARRRARARARGAVVRRGVDAAADRGVGGQRAPWRDARRTRRPPGSAASSSRCSRDNTDRPTHQAAIVALRPGERLADRADGRDVHHRDAHGRRCGARDAAPRARRRERARDHRHRCAVALARSEMFAARARLDRDPRRRPGPAKRDALAAELGATAARSRKRPRCRRRRSDDALGRARRAAEWLEPGTHVSSVGYNAPRL